MAKSKGLTVSDRKESESDNSTLIPSQAQLLMAAMGEDIPEHAKQVRPGRGTKSFTYVSHGYVTDMLNNVFKMFWDCTNLPVKDGNMYDIISYTDDKGAHKEVIACVRLRIRIYSQDGRVLETIERDGDGGKVWENNTTFADALQSARSDAFKRAAFRLGKKFGLQLYYDDEEMEEQYELRNKPRPPSNKIQMYTRTNEVGITDEQYEKVVGMSIEDTANFSAAWELLIGAGLVPN